MEGGTFFFFGEQATMLEAGTKQGRKRSRTCSPAGVPWRLLAGLLASLLPTPPRWRFPRIGVWGKIGSWASGQLTAFVWHLG